MQYGKTFLANVNQNKEEAGEVGEDVKELEVREECFKSMETCESGEGRPAIIAHLGWLAIRGTPGPDAPTRRKSSIHTSMLCFLSALLIDACCCALVMLILYCCFSSKYRL